jgi:hypothetical protein
VPKLLANMAYRSFSAIVSFVFSCIKRRVGHFDKISQHSLPQHHRHYADADADALSAISPALLVGWKRQNAHAYLFSNSESVRERRPGEQKRKLTAVAATVVGRALRAAFYAMRDDGKGCIARLMSELIIECLNLNLTAAARTAKSRVVSVTTVFPDRSAVASSPRI